MSKEDYLELSAVLNGRSFLAHVDMPRIAELCLCHTTLRDALENATLILLDTLTKEMVNGVQDCETCADFPEQFRVRTPFGLGCK